MLFVGAGGLAAQLFEDLLKMNVSDVVFWSETETANKFIKEKFKIISTDEEVRHYFETVSKSYVLCVGDIKTRKKVNQRFIELGGSLVTFITPFCILSPFIEPIGHGSMILNSVEMEPAVSIGEQCLLNKKSYYGHGCKVSSYCEIGPTAIISAEAEIGEGCLIGIGAIILPRVKIGNNVIVAAGSVVTKNIPDNAVVAGVPAVVRFFKKI